MIQQKYVICLMSLFASVFVIPSCQQDGITKHECNIKEIGVSRSLDDVSFDLPVTDSPAIMEFVSDIEQRSGVGTLVTDDGAVYVNASHSPLCIKIFIIDLTEY